MVRKWGYRFMITIWRAHHSERAGNEIKYES